MKYIPTPQWMNKNGKTIGIKDLWNVKTDGSDCWIRRQNDNFYVYDYDNSTVLLKVQTMEEAIQFVKDLRSLPCYIKNLCNSIA